MRGENWSTWEKPLKAEKGTNKLNPLMASRTKSNPCHIGGANPALCSDEGRTIQTSASQSFYRGILALINLFDYKFSLPHHYDPAVSLETKSFVLNVRHDFCIESLVILHIKIKFEERREGPNLTKVNDRLFHFLERILLIFTLSVPAMSYLARSQTTTKDWSRDQRTLGNQKQPWQVWGDPVRQVRNVRQISAVNFGQLLYSAQICSILGYVLLGSRRS